MYTVPASWISYSPISFDDVAALDRLAPPGHRLGVRGAVARERGLDLLDVPRQQPRAPRWAAREPVERVEQQLGEADGAREAAPRRPRRAAGVGAPRAVARDVRRVGLLGEGRVDPHLAAPMHRRHRLTDHDRHAHRQPPAPCFAVHHGGGSRFNSARMSRAAER